MTEVEVSLGAVVGYENLAVLIGAHSARVNIYIRVELLDSYLVTSHFEQPTERSSRNALAKTRNYAAGDENVFCSHFLFDLPFFEIRNSEFGIRNFGNPELLQPYLSENISTVYYITMRNFFQVVFLLK